MPTFKKLNKTAQHTIEYALILSLVMAGIIIAGPYVIRSWNAHVKSLEDSVTDSMRDPLLDEPNPNVTLPECNCAWVKYYPLWVGCGLDPCEPTERLEKYECSPAGCGESLGLETTKCVSEPYCCTNWGPTGLCGANAPCTQGQEHCLSVGGDWRCEDGYEAYSQECGGSVGSQTKCVKNSGLCDYHCQGELGTDPGNYMVCVDSQGRDDEHLTNNRTQYFFLNYDEDCTEGRKCEIKCCPNWCAENPE